MVLTKLDIYEQAYAGILNALENYKKENVAEQIIKETEEELKELHKIYVAEEKRQHERKARK